MSKKWLSLFLTIILFTTSVLSSYASGEDVSAILTEVFVRQELFRQYSLIYDTFSAAVTLKDGTEITGIGFTDYAAYYEADDGSVGYFPAGFIADCGYTFPAAEIEKGLIIENLDFADEKCLFVYDYETDPFMEHCVKDGQYLKYGVNEQGAIFYETSVYQRGICDESLGALYSYDANRFVFDPDMGNYVPLNGLSLFEKIDFAAMEEQVNQIIANQDIQFSHQEIVSSVYVAREAVLSYFLRSQEETFLGYNVSELVELTSQLDPMQCIRITPEGFVVIDILEETPKTADELTKWLVGAGCLIMVAGSIALSIFVPAAAPASGALMGGAIDVFMQVVVENKSLENVNWGKVAIATTSGALLGWACPMAASGVTEAVIHAGGSQALSKIAGYGVLTLCNSVVSGTTNMTLALMDGEDGWNAFKVGAGMGAVCTAGASLLSETLHAAGPKVTQLLARTKAGQWVNKTIGKAGQFIQEHQVHFSDDVEKILVPKSVHMAAKSAVQEMNGQTGAVGGSYKSLNTPGDATMERHEVISFQANNTAQGIEDGVRGEMPSVLMDTADHRMTASWGMSKAAQQFRMDQAKLLMQGEYHKAIQMGIDDLYAKFGNKYNDGIKQMIDYAKLIGWW